MDKQTKDDLKTGTMIATGTLAPFALLQSMKESKTLVIMLIVIVTLFGGLALLVSKMSGL